MKKEDKKDEEWETMLEYALPDRLTEEEKAVIRNNVDVLLSCAKQKTLDRVARMIEAIHKETHCGIEEDYEERELCESARLIDNLKSHMKEMKRNKKYQLIKLK